MKSSKGNKWQQGLKVSNKWYTKDTSKKIRAVLKAKGEGLNYPWYFRNAGSSTWYKSSVKDNTYDDVMTKARANREVYCVITDAYGSQIITEVVTLILDN